MAISVEQIDLWRRAPSETEVLEFKEAKNQFDTEKLYHYCVAIANEGGGHLLLGIQNSAPRLVVGTRAIENPVGMSRKLWDKLGFRVRIDDVAHPEGRVVVLTIPGRPLGHPYEVEGVYWMRCGEALTAMSPDVIRRIVMEGEPDWLREPATDLISSSRALELLDTEAFYTMLGIPYPSARAVMSRLIEERFLIDGGQGGCRVTRMGALLLATQLADFSDLAFKAPRVIVYKGTSKLSKIAVDELLPAGYIVGFQGLLRFIMRQLPDEEVIEDGLRRNVSMVPEIVVRELLANALVHQDFSLHGSSVLVEVFENRIEISNPGETMVPVDRLIDGMRSRNERLADLMRRVGICERRGSGIDRVVDAAESLHLPPPDFRVSEQRTTSIAYGPRSFDDMDRTERLRACFQHCALKWEMSERMTNQSLRARFKLSERKSYLVTQVISTAIEVGLIRADEKAGPSRKFARYIPFWA
jgi:ATP-dependent DNA helicase RecG